MSSSRIRDELRTALILLLGWTLLIAAPVYARQSTVTPGGNSPLVNDVSSLAQEFGNTQALLLIFIFVGAVGITAFVRWYVNPTVDSNRQKDQALITAVNQSMAATAQNTQLAVQTAQAHQNTATILRGLLEQMKERQDRTEAEKAQQGIKDNSDENTKRINQHTDNALAPAITKLNTIEEGLEDLKQKVVTVEALDGRLTPIRDQIDELIKLARSEPAVPPIPASQDGTKGE